MASFAFALSAIMHIAPDKRGKSDASYLVLDVRGDLWLVLHELQREIVLTYSVQ